MNKAMNVETSDEERANAGLHEHMVAEIRSLGLPSDALILDIGCGTGSLLRRLRACGFTNLQGVDIAPPPNEDGISFHRLDLDTGRLPLADASVALVIAVEVIEHIENLGTFMKEIYRVLKTSAPVLLTTPNVHSIEARMRLFLNGKLKQFDELGDPTHISPVFIFPFKRLIARHGFDVQRMWGWPADGFSGTSRKSLRQLANLMRALGITGSPDGDQLCMLLDRQPAPPLATNQDKARALTAHY